MSEILNLEAIEQQRILITVSLTGSDGAPVSPSDYVICAAAIGQPNPYTQRAVRKEWAASINNENSAFLLTCPGLDIAAAPWKYRILLKNRALELEWQIVSGRISLTPRACGTDGIAPAAYSVACEATPSGLVNVTLDATVGSISGTMEEVKASAALASTSAANAHADLEDARKAATTAAQAATTAAADAKTAAEAATRAEQAATDAPQACAPFVGQVQAAAVQAQQAATHAEEDANRAATAATTATEKAQIATDAAAAAAASATDLASARDTAVQAATTAQAAQQTAQLASTTATTAAENAREYAEDAQQAKQAAATSGSNAATAAQQASDSASAAAASAATAQASAATAVSAKSDLETARDTATAAATTATDAATAAATSETNATAAANAATAAQTAAEAAQAQADTAARACAIYEQRVAANAAAASDSAAAAANSATAAANSATAADNYAQSINPFVIASAIAAGTADMDDGVVASGKTGVSSNHVSVVKNTTINAPVADYIIGHGTSMSVSSASIKKCLFSDTAEIINCSNLCIAASDIFVHLPRVKEIRKGLLNTQGALNSITFSDQTTFSDLVKANGVFRDTHAVKGNYIKWAKGTTFSNLIDGNAMFTETRFFDLPDEATFESLQNGNWLLLNSINLKTLPAGMTLKSLTVGSGMFKGCTSLEIDDLARVLYTINDLQALDTPKTSSISIPVKAKHNGEPVDVSTYITANYPDLFTTMNARGWTVTFY